MSMRYSSIKQAGYENAVFYVFWQKENKGLEEDTAQLTKEDR